MKYVIKGIKPHEIYSGEKIIELLRDVGLEVQPELRKYGWSKTLDDVLVKNGNGYLMRHGDCTQPRGLYTGWQPNIHGKCPVDPEACIVRVMLADGTITERLADKLVWGKAFLKSTIVSWQFVRLAEGYEW